MRSVTATQFREQYARILREVRATGEPIVLTHRGKTVATIRPESDPVRIEPVRRPWNHEREWF